MALRSAAVARASRRTKAAYPAAASSAARAAALRRKAGALARRERRCERAQRALRGAQVGRRAASRPQAHAVEQHARERCAEAGQPLAQRERLSHRIAPGAGHQHERRLGSEQQRTHAARPLPEALAHALEGEQELGDVLEEADPAHPLQDLEHPPRAALEEPEAEAARREGRVDQHVHDPAVEELDQALGSLQEVERVLRGRRVDHDQVVGALRVELVDLLHRRVLDAARQRLRDVLIDRVLEDARAGLRRSRRSARPDRRRSASCRASARRGSPCGGTPSAASASRGSASGWLPSARTPSASASRRAGSIVSTSVRRPRRAASSASAAATVVLPTPPDPTQIAIRGRSSAACAKPAPVHAASRAEPASSAAPSTARLAGPSTPSAR